jgi:transposase-like protein
MVRAEREMLGPMVEVDEIIHWRLGERQTWYREKRLGRVRLAMIPDASGSSLIPFIRANAEPSATIVTDGWRGYLPLQKAGFTHVIKTLKDDQDVPPHVHLVFSLLKRWILGTFQGSISPDYLGSYLDEFVFRFNRRKSASRGKLFRRLVEQAVVTCPVTRKELKSKSWRFFPAGSSGVTSPSQGRGD